MSLGKFFTILQLSPKFTSVNEIEVMYDTKCINVKVERGLTFTLTIDTSPLTLLLFNLKNNATVEIHL